MNTSVPRSTQQSHEGKRRTVSEVDTKRKTKKKRKIIKYRKVEKTQNKQKEQRGKTDK